MGEGLGDDVGDHRRDDYSAEVEAVEAPENHLDCEDGARDRYPDESMGTALRRLGVRDVNRLPVVERGSKRPVGVVRRDDIVRAYNQALSRRGQELVTLVAKQSSISEARRQLAG